MGVAGTEFTGQEIHEAWDVAVERANLSMVPFRIKARRLYLKDKDKFLRMITTPLPEELLGTSKAQARFECDARNRLNPYEAEEVMGNSGGK